jgi:hypothetical protein
MITEFCLSTGFIAMLHFGLNKFFDDMTLIWYMIHSVMNVATMLVSKDEILTGLQNPYEIYNIESNMAGYMIILSLHMYHCIFFKMSYKDTLHHLVYAFFTTCYCIYYNPYISNDIAFVAIHGLPGAIDYATASLVRLGYYENVQQQKNSMLINMFFRCPFLVCLSAHALSVVLHEDHIRYELLLPIFLVAFNGIYYNYITVVSYSAALEKQNRIS